MSFSKTFAAFANKTARVSGNPITFCVCVVMVLVWALSGPIFKFSETWQLVINTGTTIITFLMVFLIQNTQNRDGMAIQTKLDELILTSDAENDFIGIEKLTDKELDALHVRCAKSAAAQAKLAKRADEELNARRGKAMSKAGAPKPPARPAAAKPAARSRARKAA